MANPFESSLIPSMKVNYNNAIQAVISFYSVPCKLYFASNKFEDCPDCRTNPVGSRGPNPYLPALGQGKLSNSNCVLCGGDGKIAVPVSKDIILPVIFDYKRFLKWGNVNDASGDAQTVCHIDLLNDLKRADYAIFNTDIQEYNQYKFRRNSEPTPLGLGDQNFVLILWSKST